MESANFKDYINQNPDRISEIGSQHLLSLVTQFLGQDYIKKHNIFLDFGIVFNDAQKEVVINKKQTIYG